MTSIRVKILHNNGCGRCIGINEGDDNVSHLYQIYCTEEVGRKLVEDGFYLLKFVDVREIVDAFSEPKKSCNINDKSKVRYNCYSQIFFHTKMRLSEIGFL